MKQTLTTNQIADALRQDPYAGWSYKGALALAEYLEELEADLGEEMELDIVALRCDFSEYDSAREAAVDFGYTLESEDDIAQDDEALEWLDDNTYVITFGGGVIVRSF